MRRLTEAQLISFQAEARATSKLNHPVILQLLDFGPTESGIPYIVLEYFPGQTLEQYIDAFGYLDLVASWQVGLDLASALDHAHKAGVLHRDVTPSNILVSCSEKDELELQVRLIDFGLAAIKLQTTSVVVQGKTIAGTPAYMSPDTALGRSYDARSEFIHSVAYCSSV